MVIELKKYFGSENKCSECGKIIFQDHLKRKHLASHHSEVKNKVMSAVLECMKNVKPVEKIKNNIVEKSEEPLDNDEDTDNNEEDEENIQKMLLAQNSDDESDSEDEDEEEETEEEIEEKLENEDVDEDRNLQERLLAEQDMSDDESDDEDGANVESADKNKEIDEKISQLIVWNGPARNGEGFCKQCNKTMKRFDHLRIHVETHLVGYNHPCSKCYYKGTTRNALENHRRSRHSIRKNLFK